MSIFDIVKASMARWQFAPPGAEERAIQDVIASAGVQLPAEFVEYLRTTNGGVGDLAVEPGYFVLWPAETIIENNRGYGLHEFLPGFFGIGSDGGGELLALDARSAQPWPVVMIPFIPMDVTEARIVAPDFESFVRLMGVRCDPSDDD